MQHGDFNSSNQVVIARAFTTLVQSGLFNLDYPDLVMASEQPKALAQALVHLNEEHIFTEDNIEIVLAVEDPVGMATALVDFKNRGIDQDFKFLLYSISKDLDENMETIGEMHAANIFERFKPRILDHDKPT